LCADITMNNIYVGHSSPDTMIYECDYNSVVTTYTKDVKTYMQIYPKVGGI